MRIYNSNNLNNNSFNTITIGNNVNVYGDSCIKSDDNFTSSLRGLSDDEKRKKIIRHFLNNNHINAISVEKYVNFDTELEVQVSGRTITISSINNKKMKIDTKYCDDNLIEEIFNKYYSDRMDFYKNCDADYYLISVVDKYPIEYSEYDVDNTIFAKDRSMRGKKIFDIKLVKRFDNLEDEDNKLLKSILDDVDDIEFYDNYAWNKVFVAYKGDKKIYLNVDKELDKFLWEIELRKENQKSKIKK